MAAPRTEASPEVTVADVVNAFCKSGKIPASHAHSYKSVMSLMVRLYRRTPVNEFGPVALTYRQAIERACDRTWPPPEHLRRRGETGGIWKQRLGEAGRAELAAWQAKRRWHPHQLRHDFGTRVINQFSAEHAQRSPGHSNLQVTQVYAKLALKKAKEVASAIG